MRASHTHTKSSRPKATNCDWGHRSPHKMRPAPHPSHTRSTFCGHTPFLFQSLQFYVLLTNNSFTRPVLLRLFFVPLASCILCVSRATLYLFSVFLLSIWVCTLLLGFLFSQRCAYNAIPVAWDQQET